MKKILFLFPVCCVFLFALLIFSCQKEENEEYEVNFRIDQQVLTDNTNLKCTPVYSLDKANYIIITIKSSNGSYTKYQSTKINIYKLNEEFYSQKILLEQGNYSLTEFCIADSSGNIIFATPASGSALANAVEEPLPITFTVNKNQPVLVPLEVVSTEGRLCGDFGLAWFPIKENIVARLGVVDYETGQFLAADLNVTADAYSKTFDLQAIANNIVSVPADYSVYNFTISSAGYLSYQGEIMLDSLRELEEYSAYTPLLIELKKQLCLTVEDIDGNTYKTVKIDNQIWMAEDLKTTRFNDGTNIPQVIDNNDWGNMTTPSYCWANNDIKNKTPYGALYNWYAVKIGKLAPQGWHVATDNDWTILTNYYGGADVAAKVLKEAGTAHWKYDDGCTNASEFTALPGGGRDMYGDFDLRLGNVANWWTSSEWSSTHGVARSMHIVGYQVSRSGGMKQNGFSVRCVKD